MCHNCMLVPFLPLYLNFYTDIQTKLPFAIVLLTKTDETNEASGIVLISFKSWLLFCRIVYQARIISRVSPAFLQQFLQSFRNFAFLRTCKLLAQYVCCRAVTDTLPPCFMEKRNIEKSSITVLVSGVAFFINNLPDSLR